MKRFLSVFLVFLLTFSVVGANAAGDTGILNTFLDPDLDTKPMARMWFVDAMAGATDDDVIEEMILGMAEGGMGGVEIAFLSDTPSIDDTEFAEEYGWGSENWINILKKVLKAALLVEGGFKVDITITSHWPPALNTIDPNDAAASQELSYSTTEVTQADIDAGYIVLTLPETLLYDDDDNAFIFTDTLVSAIVTRKLGEREVEASGSSMGFGTTTSSTETVEEFDYTKMVDVTGNITEAEAYKAGVPDAEALETWYDGALTVEDIAAVFGDEPAADEELVDGKRTEEGLRARMADTQYEYTVDLTDVDVEAGDVILTSFYRGTGQLRSGGGSYTMPYITYATNYFAVEGIEEVIKYWEEVFLSDEELVALMKENAEKTGGMGIFEDSIEASHDTPFWSYNMLEDASEILGYDFSTSVALVLANEGLISFADEDGNEVDTTRAVEDYDKVISELFNTNHMEPAKEWMESLDFEVVYRIQAYGIESMGYVVGALTAGLPEGDNATAGDDDRMLSTAVNLNPDNNLLSQEAMTIYKQELTWTMAAEYINNHSASGVNRVIFHGSSYPVCFDDGYNSWPGWNWGGMTMYEEGFNSWNSRTSWWNDATVMTDYISRLQSITQNGTASVDVAVMTNRAGSDSSYDAILDNGYSYNIMDEEVFNEALVDPEILSVTNNVLYEDGVGYRAMVVSDLEAIATESLEKIVVFAEAGLPIVLQGSTPERTYGVGTDEEDASVADMIEQLKAMDNVLVVETADEVPAALASLGVIANASYLEEGVQVNHRYDEYGDYYLFYNSTEETVTFDVSFTGEGAPFTLNLWDGSIEGIAQYVEADGTITTTLTIDAQDMLVVAIADEDGEIAELAGSPTAYATALEVVESEAETTSTGVGGLSAEMMASIFGTTVEESIFEDAAMVYSEDGELMLRATSADDDYAITVDGETITAEIPEIQTVPDLYSWTLTLQSYGPDPEVNDIDPTVSKITTVVFENVATGTAWAYLPTDQVETLGVATMGDVSGVGTYETTITLPDDWDSEVDGAYLQLTYTEDCMLAGITVNGVEFDDLNALKEYVDLGHVLVAGENTISIQIDSTLINRGCYEGGQADNPTDTRYLDGLMTAELVPYVDLSVADLAE